MAAQTTLHLEKCLLWPLFRRAKFWAAVSALQSPSLSPAPLSMWQEQTWRAPGPEPGQANHLVWNCMKGHLGEGAADTDQQPSSEARDHMAHVCRAERAHTEGKESSRRQGHGEKGIEKGNSPQTICLWVLTDRPAWALGPCEACLHISPRASFTYKDTKKQKQKNPKSNNNSSLIQG